MRGIKSSAGLDPSRFCRRSHDPEKKKSFILPTLRISKEYDAVVQYANRWGSVEWAPPPHYVGPRKGNAFPRAEENQALRGILEGNCQNRGTPKDISPPCLTLSCLHAVVFPKLPVGRLLGFAREIGRRPALQKLLFQRCSSPENPFPPSLVGFS